jgi:hypothetical protein
MQAIRNLAAALVAACTCLSAQAVVIHATFSGTVQDETETRFSVNDAISGEFFYDSATNTFVSFTIGGQSVARGFQSKAGITPDQYSAIYEAQVSPVLGGELNSTFTLDLEGVNPWPTGDAVALLLDSASLASNLDTSASSFSFYVAEADGTDIHRLTASLGTLTVAVPEPAALPLMFLGLAAIGLRRLRRA